MNVEEIIRSSLSQNPKYSKNYDKESIKIVESNKKAQTINFSDIKIYKRKYKELNEWVSYHFVTYVRNLHKKIFNQDWVLNYAPQCNAILKIKDNLLDMFGYCDNFLLKEYIDWFFSSQVFKYMGKDKTFYFELMLKDDSLHGFFMYREKDNSDNQLSISLGKELNINDIYNVLLLSEKRAIIEYGIVIMYNIFLKKQLETNIIIDKLKNILNLKNNNIYDSCIQNTCKYSPYPLQFRHIEMCHLLKDLHVSSNKNSLLSIIEFSSAEKFLIELW
jgi:hypothetical protein